MFGQRVHQATLGPGPTTLDLSHLPNGTYVLRAVTQEFHVPSALFQILR